MLPGLWRLRLPLPWPGIPHCNAWAIAAGDGIVLVDCGMHQRGSLAQLELALAQAGLALEQVRRLVITHAHVDHWGQAASVVDRAGCELLMHPNHEHAVAGVADPEAELARQLEVGRHGGVPERALRAYAEHPRELSAGIARVIRPDRELVDGVVVETDLGEWRAYETPGHAPSHVCLFQPERRLLISGDHVLGRISLFFEYGFSPDPIAEFMRSLELVDALDARLCLSGHGRTFTDVRAHVEAERALVNERLSATLEGVVEDPRSAVELAPAVFGEPLEPAAPWRLLELLCYLRHLESAGRVAVELDAGGVERWQRV